MWLLNRDGQDTIRAGSVCWLRSAVCAETSTREVVVNASEKSTCSFCCKNNTSGETGVSYLHEILDAVTLQSAVLSCRANQISVTLLQFYIVILDLTGDLDEVLDQANIVSVVSVLPVGRVNRLCCES